jgi:RNA polymerase sigma-70 factor (ECF subfamily)
MSTAPLIFHWGGELRSSPSPNLLAEARRGNREAFAQMISPHVPALYRRARGLTGNNADAEDASQEALLKAWSRLQQFTGKQDSSTDEFRAWVSRIASNASIDLLRQRHDGKVLSLEDPRGPHDETLGAGIASNQQDPEERCARREMGQLLANAIVQLPRDLRQACLLRDVLHYSTQEVADRLGISIVAVRLRLFRAHRRLREKLEESLRARRVRESGVRRHQPRMAQERNRFAPLGAAASYASGD